MSRRYGPFDPFERSPFPRQEVRIPRPPRRFWVGLGFFAAAIAVVVLANPLIFLITEGQWYGALGLGDVFVRRLFLQAGLFFGAWAFAFGVAALNIAIALRSRAAAPLRAVGIRRRWLRSGIGLVGLGAAAGVSLLLSLGASARWQDLALFLNSVPAGVREPVFGLDVSFYMLQLPLLHDINNWVLGLIFTTAILVTGIYSWRGDAFDFRLAPVAIAHLSVLFGLLLLGFAVSEWLGRYDVLYHHTGVVSGAGFADVNARIPLNTIRAVVSLLLAIALFANAYFRRYAVPAGALGVWVVLAIVAGIYPALVQSIVVRPSELQQERPYLAREIEFTRRAFGLDGVKTSSFQGDAPLTPAQVQADQGTIDNLRLWDWGELKTVYQQFQSIRTYYSFNDVDVDRYQVNGKETQVEIAAREMNTSQLSQQAQTWQNQYLIYTHGYGVAGSPVSAIDAQGLPTYLAQDIPPSGPIKVDRAQIYFGESTSDYAIAPSGTKEFDYPGPNGNVFLNYGGTHGVRLSGLNRQLWALRTGDFNLLVSGQVDNQSQMLYLRNINDRVKEIAPFLNYDSDPYVVVADGRIYWVVDGYTQSSTYPYSETDSGLDANYIRNSVKVVIDAYEGTAQFYVADPNDPIIRAYQRTFPTLFTPLDRMPPSLRAHLRVPLDMFQAQARTYRAYHTTDPGVLYNREDVWDLPLEQRGPQTQAQVLPPYYVLMRLPGEQQTEFMAIQPFTPRGKTNLVGWLATRCDAPHYGESIAYVLPRDRVIPGPQQVSAFINQDVNVSRDQTLLNQQGSQFILGNLLVVPIGDTFLYFQPVYLRSSATTSVPELKRVILAHGDQVAYQDSLQNALSALVGGAVNAPNPSGQGPAPPPPGANATVQQLAQQALQHYNAAQADLKNGDLQGYANEMAQVSQLLQQIAQASGGAPVPSPSPSPSR